MMLGDNDYTARVYHHDDEDAEVQPLQRALHFELCRPGPHGRTSTGFPACHRAWAVMRRWQAEEAQR